MYSDRQAEEIEQNNAENDIPFMDQLQGVPEMIESFRKKLEAINRSLICLMGYTILQITLIFYALYVKQNQLTVIGRRYLYASLLQYFIHLILAYYLRRTTQQIMTKLQYSEQVPTSLLRVFLQMMDYDDTKLWARITDEHKRFYGFNKTLYIIFFIIGNLLIIQNTGIPFWLFCYQFLIGWILLSVLLLMMTMICIVAPFFILYSIYFQRRRAEMRHEGINRLNQTAQLVCNLRVKPTNPCFICLQEYVNDDLVITLPCNSQHIFHQECLNPWMQTRDQCPVCRSAFL